MGKMSGLFAASKLNTNSLYYKFYQYSLHEGGILKKKSRLFVWDCQVLIFYRGIQIASCRKSWFWIGVMTESTDIECLIQDQAFSQSCDLAPPPPPFPSVSLTGNTQEDWERETTCLRERGWGRSQIIRRGEKPGPLYIVQYRYSVVNYYLSAVLPQKIMLGSHKPTVKSIFFS
jgi:hypothetical protein